MLKKKIGILDLSEHLIYGLYGKDNHSVRFCLNMVLNHSALWKAHVFQCFSKTGNTYYLLLPFKALYNSSELIFYVRWINI